MNERFIGESDRLIDDVLKVCDMQKLSGYLLTVDFEKIFDSLNHNFLIAVRKKHGFRDDFIDWILILFNSQNAFLLNVVIDKEIQFQHIYLSLHLKYFLF